MVALTLLLALSIACVGCMPTLESGYPITSSASESGIYDTQEETTLFGIQTDGVCGHSIGDEICDLVLKDQNDDVWRLYDLKGDVIILDFSAMWCGPCQIAATTVQEIQDFYDAEGFEYITILIDDTSGDTVEMDEAKFWADTFGIETQPVLQGNRDMISSSTELGYPISSWPTFVFIDRDLNIHWGIYGYSEEYIRTVIEDML